MIGASHRRRAKSPLGTVLIINLLGKGLTPRACMGDGAPFDELLAKAKCNVYVSFPYLTVFFLKYLLKNSMIGNQLLF